MKPSIHALAALSALATVAITGCATSNTANPDIIPSAQSGKVPKKANLLFVQNAKAVSFSNGKMTLRGVSPQTIAFSDRPERFAGHMQTSNFVPMWSSGRDSFLKDPPNATLSVVGAKDVTSVVMVLRNPQISGSNLTYEVQILEGAPPAHAGSASLFIDIIGMPMTPFSFAGAARRDAYYGGDYGPSVVHYGGWGGYGGAAVGPRGTASWSDGSGQAHGWRGGSASWGGGSGSATGWRGNSVSWHRR